MKSTFWSRFTLFLSGILSIIVSFTFLTNPVESLMTLGIFVASLLTVSGIFIIVDAIRLPKGTSAKPLLIIEGIMLTIIGLLSFGPNVFVTTTTLSILILFWFILSSFIQIQYALTYIEKTWIKVVIIILNIVLIALSIYTLFNPVLANSVLVIVLAIQFMTSGINRIVLSILV